jgi:hypothetical protein
MIENAQLLPAKLEMAGARVLMITSVPAHTPLRQSRRAPPP